MTATPIPILDWSVLPHLMAAVFILLVLAAACHDVIARTIPNRWCAAIALLGLLARWAAHDLAAGAAIGLAVFAATALCWRFGWLGGGDVKLLSALSVAVPPAAVLAFLADTAIAGTVLALVYLLARRRVRRPCAVGRPGNLLRRALRAEQWRLARGGPLPYAVAIAAGACLALTSGALP